MCVCEKQEQFYFLSTADRLLLPMSQVARRPTCVDCRQGCWCRGGGEERAHIAGFFQTEEARRSRRC